MPTLTRLAALILFGGAVYYASTQYHLLYDEPPRGGSGHVFLAVVAAVIGWSFVGRRITSAMFRNFTVVIQGYIAGLILALILHGFYNAFTEGYRLRYRSLDEALEGAFAISVEHLVRMTDTSFLLLLLGLAVGMTLILTVVYRYAEFRRLAR